MKKNTATNYAKQIRPLYKNDKVVVRRNQILDGYSIVINEGQPYSTRISCEESAEDYTRIHS